MLVVLVVHSYYSSFIFFSVVGVWVSRVSFDGLCPEEGFKGVRVSRSIAVVVLVGF